MENNNINIIFLLTLLFFGNKNIHLSIFLSLIWILLSYKIKENQLLKIYNN